MTAGREHFALDWLKDELDETLKAARQALESYSESERDATRMRSCLTSLHQVHGTLLMLELTGVTVLSDELEQLAQAMHDDEIADLDAAQQLLMQGILQLPAHLEEIQKGLPDTRRAVLALANDVRLARGQEAFPDAASLTPTELLQPANDETLDRFDEIEGAEKARKIRGAFQQVLLSLLKGRGRDDAAAVLSKVAVGLERICEGAPLAVLWRAFGAYLGSVAVAGEVLNGDVVKVLRRVDAEIKNLATVGRKALVQPINAELVGALVDGALERGAENAELRQLAEALTQHAASENATISGREAMQHAASALREELAVIKDGLDMFVRADERTVDGLKELALPLKQIGSTLSILGFESSREILADRVEALNASLDTGVVDDVALMGIAGALIQVDENLAGLARARATTLAGTSEAAGIISDAQIAVLNEARNGLEETKHAVVDYITAQWEVSRLEAIPDLLNAVKGALAIVPLAMPAALLGQCADYVRDQLLPGEKPDWQALDHFADAISGVDYYLERLIAESAPPGDEILAVVQRSLAALGVAALDPAEPVLMEALGADVVDEPLDAERSATELAKSEAAQEEAVQVESVDDESRADESASPDDEFYLELVDDPETESPAVREDVEVTHGVVEEVELDLQEPSATVEEPSATVEEPSATVEEPSAVVEEPSAAVQEPSAAIEKPSPALEAVEFGFDGDGVDALEDSAPEPNLVEVATSDVPTADEHADRSAEVVPIEQLVAVATEAAELVELTDEEFDEEIVEIFADEVTEVLAAVDDWLPQWADGFSNTEALAETRRAFHTLKGSGRMVGAQLIGELAWSIENMLNRIMDGTIEPSDQVAALIGEAGRLVPSLSDAFRTQQPVESKSIATIMERADALASGGRIENLGAPVEIPDETEVETAADAQVPALEVVPEVQEPLAVDEPVEEAPVADETEALDAGEPVEPEVPVVDEPEALAADEPETPIVDEQPDDTSAQATNAEADELVEAEAEPVAEPDDLAEGDHGTLADSAKDPEVMVLFEEEASRHLEILESRFNSEDDSGELELDDAVMRALHTLRGSAAMAGIDLIAGLATPLYEVAMAYKDAAQPITPDLFDFLQQGVFALRRSLDAQGAGHESDEDQALFESEAARIRSSMGADPASGVASLLQLEGTSALLDAGDQLVEWRDQGIASDALADVVAALHEIRNESQSKGMNEVADLCDSLVEGYQRFEGVALSEAAFEALEEAHEALLGMFDCIAAHQQPPDARPAIAKLAAVGVEDVQPEPEPEPESEPEPEIEAELEADAPSVREVSAGAESEQRNSAQRMLQLPDDVDEEILEIFFEEADELLEAIDHDVHEWFDERDNHVHLENLLRALHTLKGGARLAGLLELGDETHELESYVVDLQNNEAEPDDEFFSNLQRRHDELATSLVLVKALAHGEEIDPESLPVATDVAAEDLSAEAVAEDQPDGASAGDQPAEDESEGADAGSGAVTVIEPTTAQARETASDPESALETADVVPLATQSEPQSQAARGSEPREMVRVSATLLEELVNLAGENSIVRSRIEQVISDFSGSLAEMETTIERVREQLRRLEIETEAQVLFRHERSDGPAYDEFDPLEMDRYSQLQQVSKSLSETASDMLDLKETLANKVRESETLLIQQARVNTELQEGLMRTRMVPFSRMLPRLRRIVRQVARDLDKQVEFHAYNAEGELDRNVLERMVPALEHMLRNSVDHGIETPELRASFGKPEIGRIDLRLSREAGDVIIDISDDGTGIDVETVRAKAIERGLMSADAWMADDDILQFVLAPGFTTAKSVTQISGRGVGMDVVHSAVKQLGGSIEIMSMPGKGTRFTVRLPFTVSVSRALMVSVGDDMYAVPLNNIEGIVRVSSAELAALSDPEGIGFEYAGVPYKVRYLGSYIGREYTRRMDQPSVPMVLVRSGDQSLAVHVDSVQGSREIVVKSLGPQFAGVGGISGATILGDGSVVVILDLVTLIRGQGSSAQVRSEPPRVTNDPSRPTCVMVVDDSVTVRKVTSRLLERQGMNVIVAKDGVEAVALLRERRPDIILLDIEMPRMDGFEVARQVRHDEGLAELPIVMISSRTGSKHQERAAELGVNRFLGKPFQENELLSTIDELLAT